MEETRTMLWQRIPRDVLILSASFALIFMGAGAQQQFLAPLFKTTTDWSPIARGLIPAAVYLSMTTWRVPSVWIVDKIGERNAMLLGGATYVAFPAAIYLLDSYWMLVLSAVCWGIGATLMWVTSSIRVIDAVSHRNYGKASGVFTGSVYGGILVGTLLQSQIAAAFSLRTVFLAASLISACGLALMTTLRAKATERTHPNMRDLVTITRMTNWRIVGVLLGLSAMGYGLMLVPLGECIVVQLGVSSLALAAIHPAARLTMGMTSGWLSDIVGRRGVIVGGFMIGGVGLAITALSPGSPYALALGIFSIGFLGGVAPTMGLAFVGDAAKNEMRLMMHSSLFVHNDFGVAAAILAGQLLQMNTSGFTPTFGTFSIVLLICGVWSYISFRPSGRGSATA